MGDSGQSCTSSTRPECVLKPCWGETTASGCEHADGDLPGKLTDRNRRADVSSGKSRSLDEKVWLEFRRFASGRGPLVRLATDGSRAASTREGRSEGGVFLLPLPSGASESSRARLGDTRDNEKRGHPNPLRYCPSPRVQRP